MKVDLPAPFWPSKARISPGAIVRLRQSTATTPGNSFVMPRAETTAAPDAATGATWWLSGATVAGMTASPRQAGLLARRLVVRRVLVDFVDVEPVLMRAGEFRHLLPAHQIDRRLHPRNVGGVVVDLVGRADVLALGHGDRGLGARHRHLVRRRPDAAEHAAFDDRLRRRQFHVLPGDR